MGSTALHGLQTTVEMGILHIQKVYAISEIKEGFGFLNNLSPGSEHRTPSMEIRRMNYYTARPL